MFVVFEGNDGSGKSTLIRALRQRGHFIPYHVVESEGPPKHAGEMTERVRRYLSFPDDMRIMFDRHPCVSNPMYDVLRRADGKPIDSIPRPLIDAFYGTEPLFVYCDPIDNRHDSRADEDADHLEMVARQRSRLTALYREWAMQHATIVYRIGDNVQRIGDMIEAAVKANS